MRKNDKLVVITGVLILIIASIGITIWNPEDVKAGCANINEFFDISGTFSDIPNAITTSTDSPFYPLIATPIAVHYDKLGNQNIIPLYIENQENPSDAIIRAEDMIGITSDYFIGNSFQSLKEISLEIAERFWDESEGVMIIENSSIGYELGVAAAPIASYLSIPIIITDSIDSTVIQTLDDLGVTSSIVCGNISGYQDTLYFKNIDEIVNASIDIIENKFGEVNYITLTNPLDINEEVVLDSEEHSFKGTLSSSAITASHIVNLGIGTLTGTPMTKYHTFEIPYEYKYAKIIIDARNLAEENVEETGGQLILEPYNPDSERMGFLFTIGGIPERDSSGGIVEDKLHWETIVYDDPGEYAIAVTGRYMTQKTGDYEVDITIENIESPLVPSMKCLSSTAPYLTAYHKGLIFAKPEFAFAADETILSDPASGIVYPVSNPDLIEDSNEHTFVIHEEINNLLAKLAGVELKDLDDLEHLKNIYEDDPIYITLVGDSIMLPHYYYYDTEDAVTIFYGWDVASDFIYGNIDPVPRDDKISIFAYDEFLTDPYDEKYPNQENMVGRITGWDVQDANALIVRTLFYNSILENIDEEWKDTATVQTGSGTDFQRLYGVDAIRKIFRAGELPTKWPTGAGHFENMMISKLIESGGFDVRSTENVDSARRGFSDETLEEIRTLGILNRFLFPKPRVKFLASEEKIKGGENQEDSNFIYSFGHGQPMGFSQPDVQLDSLGFRPVLLHQLMNRWFLHAPIPFALMSGLGTIGGYNVRAVENMELGPSVMMVESCYVGRIDGLYPQCAISQAYIHAGVNSFIASTRGTPGPGYLDARKNAKGFGISEFIKTRRNPDLQEAHFSSLHAVNIFGDLIEHDYDIGTAFKNAKNKFMEDEDSTFFWTPPLALDIQTQADYDLFKNNIRPTSDAEDAKCMEKKYTCLFEYILFGDPAFNPYEPTN